MKTESEKLIADLIKRTRININNAELLNQKSIDELSYKPTPEQWSPLECIEHLNYYSDFYIPEINLRVTSSDSSTETFFKSGLLGN